MVKKIGKKAPAKKTATKKAAPKKAKPARTPAKKLAVKPKLKMKAKPKAVRKTVKLSTKTGAASKPQDLQEWMRDKVITALEDGKAESVVCVDVRGQSSIADFLVIASGRSNRQVKFLGETVQKALYASGVKQVRIEGTQLADWVVVDGGDVIVHIFRPEVRSFYRLEEVWGLEPPLAQTFKDL